MDSNSDSGFESAPPSPSGGATQSRRVIFHVPNITLTQLLTIIRGEGGIISAAIFDTQKIDGLSARTAVVEFKYPASARAYSTKTASHSVGIEDENGAVHYPRTWRPSVPRNSYHQGDSILLRNGFTRAIRAAKFPAKAVWFFLNTMGLQHITNASYESGALSVEFVSIFQAARATRILREGSFPYYKPDEHDGPLLDYNMSLVHPEIDSTDSHIEDLEVRTSAFIPHDHLARKFDRLPYNQTWPDTWSPIMGLQGLEPRSHRDGMLEMIQKHAAFSRNTWSWDIPPVLQEDHNTVLNTFADPDWNDA
ncbi:hypothetical protein ACRE_003510 [Hapsidospora chrysogenum ATCC 11550]|uniref:RRM domain-containing protein n=1 Tax=Hapsidospora chrysogenum (strain ATCC 11550 / CBS 779.69 / DSM 880 / IAM 14645 / JCM 23072 / IMI 49137) TaxID=857340 RepID=A0A086TGY2_HAPC1|nr:hypothetical protein ACRE_003510 [Hapsidospora chrysogenum ATCC 11550]